MTATAPPPAARRPVTYTTTAHCRVKGCGWVQQWHTRHPDEADDQVTYAEAHLDRHTAQHTTREVAS